MPDTERQKRIDEVLDAHENDPTQIVGILLDVQELNTRHYIPESSAWYIAHRLHIPVADVFDCIAFYSALSDKPRARYPIGICFSPSCRVSEVNSAKLESMLTELLGIHPGEVTYDGRFGIERTMCAGACDYAPYVRINGKIYGHLDTCEKLKTLLQSLN